MFRKIALLATLLTLIVVVMGAYTRLSDAGLGCPDWPGCYGHLLGVPESSAEIDQANQAFPERAVESGKAWKEMIHRYLAEGLGLLIVILAIVAIAYPMLPSYISRLTWYVDCYITVEACNCDATFIGRFDYSVFTLVVGITKLSSANVSS